MRKGRHGVAFLLLLASCTGGASRDPNAIRIGLLLPFTGESSALGYNYESAALMVVDDVNDAGGVQGRPLQLVTRDTRSRADTGVEAFESLVREDVVAVVGPESLEIATEILPRTREEGILFVSPVIGAGAATDVPVEAPWFRLSPSPQLIGESMGMLIYNEGVRSIAIVASTDAYDAAFLSTLVARFEGLGGTVAHRTTLGSDIDYVAVADASRTADAIVLAAPARPAADLVTAITVASPEVSWRWFLSPLLRTDDFVLNTPSGSLEGAVGLTPRIFEPRADFAEVFGEHFRGDSPLDGAYFYFDAFAALALALEGALRASPELENEALRDAVRANATVSGGYVNWLDYIDGLARIRGGQPVFYSGLVGPLRFTQSGERANGVTTVWTITEDHISDAMP